MSEVAGTDLSGQVPEDAICADCARHGAIVFAIDCVLAYCSHSRAGAFRVSVRPWQIRRDISLDSFRAGIARGVLQAELRADVDAGVAKILQQQAAGATKH